ncbi:MAG: ferrous iron transport protein B [Thermoprotei archaeon]
MATQQKPQVNPGKKTIRVAVAGQPNVGKSTLFNVLTNNRVLVANWPGVTVEKHYGKRKHRDYEIEFVDLPGTYGFSSLTIEERIARNYILSGEPDVVLVLVDSLNPERTMYLAIQTLELTPRVVIALTKIDAAHPHGIHINADLLSKRLKAPVIPVSAVHNIGIEELLDTIIDRATRGDGEPLRIDYGELEPFIKSIEEILAKHVDGLKLPVRWAAVRLIEGDHELEVLIKEKLGEEVLKEILRIREEASIMIKRDLAELAASKRFEYIFKLLDGVVIRSRVEYPRLTRIAKILYNPLWGSVASIVFLTLVFIAVFTINTGFPLNVILEYMGMSEYAALVEEYSLSGLVDTAFTLIGGSIYSALGDTPTTHLIVDGILGGVGAILVFLPLVFIVALALAILEDSGIAPRIAVGLHSTLSRIGISGHAVFPMMLGLGCNVPAILATRGTPDPLERLRLILTLAFIPCQARLVVLLALATALQRLPGGVLILLGYLVAFVVFAIVNKVLYEIDRRRGRAVSPEILIELPPVHKPVGKVVWWLTWSNTKHFLVKAGIVIFTLSIIVWFMTSYTPGLAYTEEPSESIAFGLAKIFSPLLEPIGLSGDPAWIVALALLMGFIAKEVVVSTLIVATGASSAREAIISLGLTDAQVTSIALFTVLYVPCLATIAVIYSETRSIKYTLLAVAIMMSIGYLAMITTYYVGSLLGF